MADQHDDTSVRSEFACPWCGERLTDLLVWVKDDVAECQTCGCRYGPGDGMVWLAGRSALKREVEP